MANERGSSGKTITFYGQQFPVLPSTRTSSAPKPGDVDFVGPVRPPAPTYEPTFIGPVRPPAPSYEPPPTYNVPTTRPTWNDAGASSPRYTPPSDEVIAPPELPTYRVQSTRQRTAAERAQPMPPDLSTMSPMQQANQYSPPIIETTTEAPRVPGLRNAALVPPLVQSAAPLFDLAGEALGALPGLLGNAGRAAVQSAAQSKAGEFVLDRLGRIPAADEQRPTNLAGEWQRARATGSPISGGLYLAQRPFEVTTEKPIAAAWTSSQIANASPEMQRLQAEDARLAARLTGLANDAAGYRERATIANQRRKLATEMNRLRTETWTERGLTNVTPEEQGVYRTNASMGLQFITGALYDPLNILDFIGDSARAARLVRQADELTGPAKALRNPYQRAVAAITRTGPQRVLTLDEVAQETVNAVEKANSWLGRMTPWQTTPESMAHAHVNQAADSITRMSEAFRDAATNEPQLAAKFAQAGDEPLTGMFKAWLADPDDADIVRLTGGYSQSRESKRTVILVRKLLGTTDEATAGKALDALKAADAKVARATNLFDAAKTKLDNLMNNPKAPAAKVTAARQAVDKAQQFVTEATDEAARLRRTTTKVGDINFPMLEKILKEAGDDDLKAVADLARGYEDAARQIYARPVTKQVGGLDVTEYKYKSNAAKKVRGQISNVVSTMYLGTNPGYAFRNAANNLFTAVVDGVSPVQSADSIRALWTKWGPPPWATKQGVGAQGDIWKSRQKAQDYITGISTPMRLRDVFKAIETASVGDKLSVTLQLGQNFERYASERIVAHHIRNFWQQVWPKTVKRLTSGLEAQGFTRAQVNVLRSRLDPCMNPQDVRRTIEDFISGTPPATQAKPKRGAPGPVAPAPVRPAPTPQDANLHIPPEIADEVVRQAGPEALDDIVEIVNTSKTSQEAAIRIEILQAQQEAAADTAKAIRRTDTAVEEIETMLGGAGTEFDPLAYKTLVRNAYGEIRDIEREYWQAHNLRTRETWRRVRGMDWMTASPVWERYWDVTLKEMDNFHAKLNTADEQLGKSIGMSEKAVTRAKAYRTGSIRHKTEYTEMLRDTWSRSRATKDGAGRDAIWDEFYAWSDAHYAAKDSADWDYLNTRIDDINEAIDRTVAEGKLGRGKPPATAAPVPPRTPSTPPTSPAAPAQTPGQAITDAFTGMEEGIKQGARDKADEYARRIMAGESADDVLQGSGPAMRANVQKRIDELTSPAAAVSPDKPSSVAAKPKVHTARMDAGDVVVVNEQTVTLTAEQADEWNRVASEYTTKINEKKELLAKARNLPYNGEITESLNKSIKALGMQWSAEKRRITGTLTKNEQRVAPKPVSPAAAVSPTGERAMPTDAGMLPELGGPELPAGAPTSGTVRYVEPEPQYIPVHIPGDKVQEAMNRAQVIANHWKTKVGSYTDTPEGLEAGGRSGKAIGGTYKDINERRAAKQAGIFEAYAQRGERGLSQEEIAAINAAWKRFPLEIRDPERYARRQAAKEARLAPQQVAEPSSIPQAPTPEQAMRWIDTKAAYADEMKSALKARSMEYQADLKDRVAEYFGRNPRELYEMPYDEWAALRQQYFDAIETPQAPQAGRLPYEVPGIVGDYDMYSLPPSAFDDMGISADMWPVGPGEQPRPIAPTAPRLPYETPSITWEGEPGRMPPSYAPYPPRRVEPSAPEPQPIAPQAPDMPGQAASLGDDFTQAMTDGIRNMESGITSVRRLPDVDGNPRFVVESSSKYPVDRLADKLNRLGGVTVDNTGSANAKTFTFDRTMAEQSFGARVGSDMPGQAAREPWQIPPDEYLAANAYKYGVGVKDAGQRLLREHADSVESALREGKDVPLAHRSEWAIPFSEFQAREWGRDETGLRLAAKSVSRDQEEHRKLVEQALRNGKPVPAEVLAEYPDLQQGSVKAGGAALPQGTPQSPVAIRERIRKLEDSLASGEARLRTKRNALGERLSDAELADVEMAVASERRQIAELQQQLDGGVAQTSAKPVHPTSGDRAYAEREIGLPPEPTEPDLIPISMDDVDYDFARQAYGGISWMPEQRAVRVQRDYVEHIRGIQDNLRKYADTPEKQAKLVEHLKRYQKGYIEKLRAYLSAKGRVVSSFVAGPSNFPTQQMAKRTATEDRRFAELTEWSQKAQKAMREDIAPSTKRAISSDDADAVAKLQAKIDKAEKWQELMVAANKVVRKKIGDDAKITELGKLGIKEEQARKLLVPDFAGRIGFPDYEIKNNSANIKRMKGRVTQVAAEKGKATAELTFDGGRVLDNADNNRVQIFFDEKPSLATRTELKKSGFRWAPSEGAWQRLRNDSARGDVERILGVKFEDAVAPGAADELADVADEFVAPKMPDMTPEEAPPPSLAEAGTPNAVTGPRPQADDKFVQFRRGGIKGANDNTLVAYQHIRTKGEKYSRYEGGSVGAKVSDFERAEKCATCNRNIVHVFWVKDTDGVVKPFGKEHVHTAMGWKQPVTDAKAESLIAQISAEETRHSQLLQEADKYIARATTDITDANLTSASVYKNNPTNTVLLIGTDGKLIRTSNSQVAEVLITEHGYQPSLINEGFKKQHPDFVAEYGQNLVPRKTVAEVAGTPTREERIQALMAGRKNVTREQAERAVDNVDAGRANPPESYTRPPLPEGVADIAKSEIGNNTGGIVRVSDYPELRNLVVGRDYESDGWHAIRRQVDQLDQVTFSKLQTQAPAQTAPTQVTVIRQGDLTTASPDVLAADYKARGMDRYRAWDQFIIDRGLRPEMDAKKFYDIFDSAGPRRFVTRTTEAFQPTHIDLLVPDKPRLVQITQAEDGNWKMLWEDGSTGTNPASIGFNDFRFRSLTEDAEAAVQAAADPIGTLKKQRDNLEYQRQRKVAMSKQTGDYTYQTRKDAELQAQQLEDEIAELDRRIAGQGAVVTAPADQAKAAKVKKLITDALANNGMRGRRVPGELYGDDNAAVRVAIIEAITGKKPVKSKAGVGALEQAVYDFVGIDRKNMSGIEAEKEVMAWLKGETPAPTGNIERIQPMKAVILGGDEDSIKVIDGYITTPSGRRIPGPPLLGGKTDRVISGNIRKYDQWLLDEAISEAKHRGDTWNEQQFGFIRTQKMRPGEGLYPQADRELLSDYLFGTKSAERFEYIDTTKQTAPELSPAERQAQHEALLARRDREASETSAIGKLQSLREQGQAAFPGVRLQDAEEAGRMVQMRDAGQLRPGEFDAYAKDLLDSNKISRDQRAAFLEKYPQVAPAADLPPHQARWTPMQNIGNREQLEYSAAYGLDWSVSTGRLSAPATVKYRDMTEAEQGALTKRITDYFEAGIKDSSTNAKDIAEELLSGKHSPYAEFPPLSQVDAMRATQAAPKIIRQPWEMAPEDFVSSKELRNEYAQFYADKSSRNVPYTGTIPEEGTWRIDEHGGIYGHEIEQLRSLDPDSLVLSEDMVAGNIEGRGWDAERYTKWIGEGKQAPPINVVELDDGRFRVSDGHRRVEAAKRAGKPILAWVSPAMETGAVAFDGKPIKAGLTYEMALLDAMKSGKQVDSALVQRIVDDVQAGKYGSYIPEKHSDIVGTIKQVVPTAQDTVLSPSTIKNEATRQVSDRIRVADIAFDPDRLQYKLDVDARTGVTKQFANTKTWNPALGRGISVWIDPADGKTYVVNGHHRLEIAKRLNAEHIEAPYYIQVETAEEARLIGALQNIAEGRGTSVDAAKLFKEAAFDMAMLDRWGLALSENTVRNGLALSNLNDTIFASVVRKEIPVERAVIIGERLPNHDMQMQLIRALDQQMNRGRKITNDVVSELADAMNGGPQATVTQNTLFGEEVLTQSYAFEKAEFYAYVRGRLAKEKRLFGVASQNAEELRRAGQIDADIASTISDDAARLLDLFDTLKNQRGIISDIGNEAAEAMAKGGNPNAIKDNYYKRITDAIPDALQRRTNTVSTGDIARTGTTGAPAGQADLFGDEPSRQTGPGLFDFGIVAPGTVETQKLLNRILGRHGMDVNDANIISAQGMRPLYAALRDLWARPPEYLPAVTPEQAAILRKLAQEGLLPNMVKNKAMVNNLATNARNFALGDYQNKRNIHEALAYVFPWSYWYTFTYPNWAQRLATHPSWVAKYARYREVLAKTNQDYYREQMGDPNAVMPEYWEDQVRVPFFGTQLYFDLERTLLPMQALLNDFNSRTRNDAPGPFNIGKGSDVNNLQEWGPSLWPPLIWAYAAWLSANGHKDAAEEWVGYVLPPSRAIKGATALLREAGVPGLPAGGVNPEFWNPMTQGGDTWERRRIGFELYNLYRAGRIDERQFQDAAYNQSGEAWDMARQAEAVKRAPGNIASYMLGAGFKARNADDIEIDKLNREWAAIWDARYNKGVTEDVWRGMLAEYNKKYPMGSAVRMAKEKDPTQRLKDYGYMVFDRLPPGAQRYDALREAGLTDEIISRFYADKGDTSKWQPYEVKALQAGIEKLAALVNVPDAATRTEYTDAKSAKTAIDEQAAKAVGQPLATLKATESQYFDIKDAQGADAARAFLAQHPELKKYWDAKNAAEQNAPDAYNKYYNQPTTTGATGKAGAATPAADPEKVALAKKYDEADKKFGPQVAGWADERSAIPKGPARDAWDKANPEKLAALRPYWDYIYGDTRTSSSTGTSYGGTSYGGTSSKSSTRAYASPGISSDYAPTYKPYDRSRSYGGGGRYGGGSSTPPQSMAPYVPPEAPAYERWTADDLDGIFEQERMEDAAFDTFVALRFGGNILQLAQQYATMSAEQRAAWIAKNQQLYARLLKFLAWLMQQSTIKSDYTRQLQSIPPNAPNVSNVPSAPQLIPQAPPI